MSQAIGKARPPAARASATVNIGSRQLSDMSIYPSWTDGSFGDGAWWSCWRWYGHFGPVARRPQRNASSNAPRRARNKERLAPQVRLPRWGNPQISATGHLMTRCDDRGAADRIIRRAIGTAGMATYYCEWDNCNSKFWSIIDLERHLQLHIDLLSPEWSRGSEAAVGGRVSAAVSRITARPARRTVKRNPPMPRPAHASPPKSPLELRRCSQLDMLGGAF